MKIAVDFDGTLCTHRFPLIGEDTGGCEVVKALQKKGHKVFLYTMRSNQVLNEAVAWCAEHDLTFDSINTDPGQWNWTTSPKCHADLYIDDAALGVPLEKGHVDWFKVTDYLVKYRIFTEQEGKDIKNELARFL